jgi:DNA polymerase III epsilon subunit-like protein
MKIVFFDTETTWLNNSYVVQLWMIIWEYKDSWEVIREECINLLFNPLKWIEKGASDIHWITDDIVAYKPLFSSFFKIFIKNILQADYIVGHNVTYDIKVIENELDRFYKKINQKEPLVEDFMKVIREKSVDTMLASVDFCKITWKFKVGYKRPKLLELYKKLFNKEFVGAHDAMADITATKECFFELKRRDILKLNIK